MAAGGRAAAVRRERAQTAGGRRQSYVHGTAALKQEAYAVPQREEQERRRRNQSSVRQGNRIRRNQERAMYMDLPYVILLTIASICTLYLCVNYLHVQSSITARMHNIESLETQLEQMKAENDALETSINTSKDRMTCLYADSDNEVSSTYLYLEDFSRNDTIYTRYEGSSSNRGNLDENDVADLIDEFNES